MLQEGSKQAMERPIYLAGAVALFVIVGVAGALYLAQDAEPPVVSVAPRELEIIRTYGPDVRPEPMEAEAPAEPVYQAGPIGEYDLGLTQATLDGILAELGQLRNRIAKVEHDNSVLLNSVVSDIKEQNRRLLSEIQRLYAMMPDNRHYAPPPDFRDLPGEGQAEVRKPSTITAVATQGAGTVKYRILRQWGRTPEEAAANPGVSSQINLIGLVTPGAPLSALHTMAKELAAQYGEYEAMDIALFDDEEAAEAFYAENADPGPHRVISVMKRRGQTEPAVRVQPSAPPAAPPATPAEPQPERTTGTEAAEGAAPADDASPQPSSPDNS